MLEEWHQVATALLFIIIFTIILVKFSRSSIHHDLRARADGKGHYWCFTGMFSQPSYCNTCETLIIASEGAFCGACGVCADQPDCVTEANHKLQCKSVSVVGRTLRHHWIKGNLPLGAVCEVCEEECGTGLGLSDVRCCWCQRNCHTGCQASLSEVCDLLPVKQFVVPPQEVSLRYSRLRKQYHIKTVTAPSTKEWKPVIIIGNSSSGSQEAGEILSSLRRILNPAQVADLSQQSPVEALDWCRLLPHNTFRVIVAGGDGTVGWVFNTIRKMTIKNPPYISILPLGTGNDLSRVLGWGDSHSGTFDALSFLNRVNEAKPSTIDRWRVSFTPTRHLAGLHMPSRQLYMNNYLSVGVDALVTLNFHKTRQSPFYICSNRTINKLIYFTFGTKDVLMQECKHLHKNVDLYMDGAKVDLPEIEALVVLNIQCWGAGVRPWTLGAGGVDAPRQSFHDGLLEVFGVSSSFHIAQMQMGLAAPLRIGQCSRLQLCLKTTCPMQVDGEPWLQTRGKISVSFSHKANILVCD